MSNWHETQLAESFSDPEHFKVVLMILWLFYYQEIERNYG